MATMFLRRGVDTAAWCSILRTVFHHGGESTHKLHILRLDSGPLGMLGAEIDTCSDVKATNHYATDTDLQRFPRDRPQQPLGVLVKR